MNTELKNKGGRPPGYISYRHTSYNNKEYVIATLEYKGGDINFIFDEGFNRSKVLASIIK